jgi:restriction endonuclease S subunit
MQLRDVSVGGEIQSGQLARVDLTGIADRYLVKRGDVIFRSRGDHTIATVFSELVPETVVAILPLIILRPDVSILTPDFLAWSINLPTSQRHLDASSQGGSVRMVSKSSLEGLQIYIPDLQTQRRIIAADSLARREAVLAASLAEQQLTLTTLVLADVARRIGTHPSERTNS